jgi:hypothetical protein
MTEPHIVMMDSDDAASVRSVTGWVSRDGFFFAGNERAARYAGATHRWCDGGCGTPIPKNWLMTCHACSRKERRERFLALPVQAWNGEPLCVFDDDTYFFDGDVGRIAEWAADHEIPLDAVQLVKCVAVYPNAVDPADVYADELPESGEVPVYVADAFAALNEALRQTPSPLCWRATDIRVDISDEIRVCMEGE